MKRLRCFRAPGAEVLLSSYALTPKGLLVPLLPRHMDDGLWRELCELRPTTVVVDGRHFHGLCEACEEAMSCMIQRSSSGTKFKCQAQAAWLRFA